MTEKSRREKDRLAHASFRALKRGKTNEINNSSRQNRKAMNLGCFEMHTSCVIFDGSEFSLNNRWEPPYAAIFLELRTSLEASSSP